MAALVAGQFDVGSNARLLEPADAENRQMPEGRDAALFERSDEASSPKCLIWPEGV